jgi:hypothetical protein
MKVKKFDEPVYNERTGSSTFYHLTVELDGEVVYLIDYEIHEIYFGLYAGYLWKSLPFSVEPDASRDSLARTIGDIMDEAVGGWMPNFAIRLDDVRSFLTNRNYSLTLSKNTMTRKMKRMTTVAIMGMEDCR